MISIEDIFLIVFFCKLHQLLNGASDLASYIYFKCNSQTFHISEPWKPIDYIARILQSYTGSQNFLYNDDLKEFLRESYGQNREVDICSSGILSALYSF